MAKKARAYGENIKQPPFKVKHADLKRYSDSAYKSVCPRCIDGVLACRRNPKTFKLEQIDFCLSCGQQFIYTDITKLRKLGG